MDSEIMTTAEERVASQYADRPRLRSILDRLIELAQTLGLDVAVKAREHDVELVTTRRTFAVISAPTKSQVELGLRFERVPASDRLERADGEMTHRLLLRGESGVDEDLRRLLRLAYEQNR